MRSIAEIYSCELKKSLKRFGVWEPGSGICLGDVICLQEGVMHHHSTLQDYKIDFEEETVNIDPDAVEEYMTCNSVSVQSGIRGGIPNAPKNKLSVEIHFSRENAIYYNTKGVRTLRIKNQPKLARQIMRLYEQGKWERDLCVVTQLTVVDSAVILISRSANSLIEFSGEGDAELQNFSIADLKLGFSLSRETGSHYKKTFTRPTPLLFEARRIKSRLFSGPRFMKYVKKAPESSIPEYTFSPLTVQNWSE